MATDDKPIKWTPEDMIESTLEHFGREDYSADDCTIVPGEDERGPYLVIVHVPTGRSSDEAGDSGKWNLDGTARS